MIVEALLLLVIVLVAVGGWIYVTRQRPRYLVTVQRTTNSNQSPEVCTVQANLPACATPDDLWMALEQGGLAATARAMSINQDIIDETTKISDAIAARQAERRGLHEELVTKRLTKKVARLRGISPKEVTKEMLAEARAQADAALNGPRVPVS